MAFVSWRLFFVSASILFVELCDLAWSWVTFICHIRDYIRTLHDYFSLIHIFFLPPTPSRYLHVGSLVLLLDA